MDEVIRLASKLGKVGPSAMDFNDAVVAVRGTRLARDDAARYLTYAYPQSSAASRFRPLQLIGVFVDGSRALVIAAGPSPSLR